MLTGTFTVETTAPPDVAYKYLADLRHHTRWRADVIDSIVETGDPGDDGTIYRQHVHQGPATSWRRIRAHLGPGLTVHFETLGTAPVRASGTSTIEPRPTGGTSIQSTIRITFEGPGRLLRPVVRQELNRRLERYPRALKRQLDAQISYGY